MANRNNQNQGQGGRGGQQGGNQGAHDGATETLLDILQAKAEDIVGQDFELFHSVEDIPKVVQALPGVFWNTLGSVVGNFRIPPQRVKDPTARLALEMVIRAAAGATHGVGDALERAKRKADEVVLLNVPVPTSSPPVGAKTTAPTTPAKPITAAQLEEDEKYLKQLTDTDRAVLVAVFRMLRADVAQKLDDAIQNHNLTQEGWRGCPPTLLQPALRHGLDAAGKPTEDTKKEVLAAVDIGSRLGNPAAAAVAMDQWTALWTAIKKKDLGLLQKVLRPLNWLGFILLGLFVVWLVVTITGVYFLASGFLGGHIVHLFVGISVLLVSVVGLLLAAGAVIAGVKGLIPGGE